MIISIDGLSGKQSMYDTELVKEILRQILSYLRSKYVPDAPQRGSAAAVLQALEQVGPLQFAPGELESLLAEVQTMRDASNLWREDEPRV